METHIEPGSEYWDALWEVFESELARRGQLGDLSGWQYMGPNGEKQNFRLRAGMAPSGRAMQGNEYINVVFNAPAGHVPDCDNFNEGLYEAAHEA